MAAVGGMSRSVSDPPVRLAYLVTHPIQYQAPLLRRIAAMPEVDLHVFYQSDVSTRSYHDRGFGQAIAWDVPLLEGYAHTFLPPLGRVPTDGLPTYSRGLARALATGRFDALWVHGYARPFNMLAAAYALGRGLRVLVRDDVHKLGNRRRLWRERVKQLQMRLLSALGVRFLAIGTLNADYYRELGVAERNIFMARSLFLCWERSFWQPATMPVGRWVMRTAESVVFTCWPPLPPER